MAKTKARAAADEVEPDEVETPTPAEQAEALLAQDRAADIMALRTGGLVSDNLRMHDDRLVTMISAVRAVNVGRLDHASLQSLLDAFFGPGQVASTDVALARVPTANFSLAVQAGGRKVKTIFHDADLMLDDSNVRWVFGDGHIAYGKEGVEHEGPEDIGWARCELAVGGEVWTDTEETHGWASDAFDPADHTADEVIEYVEQHPDEVRVIAEMEQAGKARKTLLGKLDSIGQDDD